MVAVGEARLRAVDITALTASASRGVCWGVQAGVVPQPYPAALLRLYPTPKGAGY